jgi:hypothetical protein
VLAKILPAVFNAIPSDTWHSYLRLKKQKKEKEKKKGRNIEPNKIKHFAGFVLSCLLKSLPYGLRGVRSSPSLVDIP